MDRSEEAELRRLESGAPVTASVHVNLIDDDEAPPQESGRTPLDELDAIDDSALMEAVEAAAAERSGLTGDGGAGQSSSTTTPTSPATKTFATTSVGENCWQAWATAQQRYFQNLPRYFCNGIHRKKL